MRGDNLVQPLLARSNLQVLGAELPCDTCVQVDMRSTGRGGCAYSTLTSIPGRNLLLFTSVWYILRCGDAVYAMLWLCGGIGVHDEHFLLYLLWYSPVQEGSASFPFSFMQRLLAAVFDREITTRTHTECFGKMSMLVRMFLSSPYCPKKSGRQ